MYKPIALIAAMTQNFVIGHHNKMPWHLPAELAYFKNQTRHKPVVMGRKTFESIGRALPQRPNIVISRQTDLSLPGCTIFNNLPAALSDLSAKTDTKEIMIIGGAHLFEQTLPIAQRLYLTLIDVNLPGDTFFPMVDKTLWTVVTQCYHPADQYNQYGFLTQILERRETIEQPREIKNSGPSQVF